MHYPVHRISIVFATQACMGRPRASGVKVVAPAIPYYERTY